MRSGGGWWRHLTTPHPAPYYTHATPTGRTLLNLRWAIALYVRFIAVLYTFRCYIDVFESNIQVISNSKEIVAPIATATGLLGDTSQSTSISKTLSIQRWVIALYVCSIVVLCNLRHSAYACHFLTCYIFIYITVWYGLVGVTHSGVMYDNGPLEHVSGTVAHEGCHFWGRTTAAKSYQMVTNGQ